MRKRVLIVNCYFDHSRQPLHRRFKLPQAVGPIYLAGAFSRELCEVRCYTELASGPLEDEQLLAWPDMLVLTGLTNSFDRMLHLTAYSRSKNPNVIVVAGGPAVRALPLLARHFFDFCCLGDVEELCEVVADAFGPAYVTEQITPRYDLAYQPSSIGYIETTRYCNFRCAFCSLTGERHPYQTHSLDYIRRQILALGKKKRVFIVDNNFYGNDREHFHERIKLLKEMRQNGHFNNWSALVTNDFFSKQENLSLVKDAGCELLFCGVESFDSVWLRNFNKPQNIGARQVELIKKCLKMGVVFSYGLIADVTTRSLADIRRELEFILATPEITLPSFVSLSIPILGTPYFFDSLGKGLILPNTKVRDMDGTTVLQKPLDPIDKVVKFMVDDVPSFGGYSRDVIRHAARFARLYKNDLTKTQLVLATGGSLSLCAQRLLMSLRGRRWLGKQVRRTHVSTTEPLDHMYTPAFRVDARFKKYFKPTMVTDENGQLHNDLLNSGLLEKRVLA